MRIKILVSKGAKKELSKLTPAEQEKAKEMLKKGLNVKFGHSYSLKETDAEDIYRTIMDNLSEINQTFKNKIQLLSIAYSEKSGTIVVRRLKL